jgi:CRISPR-associated protein Csx10
VFQGRIVAEGDAAGALEELVKGNRELRMGRARTRGGGLAEMRLIPEAQGPTQTDRARAKQRIESMWRKAQELGGRLSQKHVVTVTLRSPALVWDEYLMTRAWLNAADVGLAPEWKLMGWYSEMTPVTGWHAAAGVPRTELLMVAAGSCFAYASAAPAKADELVEWAVKLEYEGIGDRRDEGFGEAVACHEMHARQAEVQ